MATSCTNDPNEVIAKIVSAKSNADKFDLFVNGSDTQSVQLGAGEPTPVIRNVVRQMFSAAAEIPDTDVSGKTVVADGATESRSLAVRFSDVVNVKDFGAAGDGTTDDTAAFQAAAATGKQVLVPLGTYKVTQKVAGTFFSLGKAVVPFVDVDNVLAEPVPHPSLINGKPLDVGEDLPAFSQFSGDTWQWPRSIQAPFVDPFDNVLYVLVDPYVTTSVDAYKTQMVAMHWGERTEERTEIGKSTPMWGYFNHGGTGIWRPTKDDPPLFASLICKYDTSGASIGARRHVQLLSWDCNDPETAPEIVRTVRLFKDSETSAGITFYCMSPDQRKVVAGAVMTGGTAATFRVWDADVVYGQTFMADVSELYERQFLAPEGMYGGGQGIYCDGQYIYVLSGTEQWYIQVMTLDGQIVFNRLTQPLGRDAYLGTVARVTCEPEGIFWAKINGKLECIAGMTLNVYPTGTTTTPERHARYVALSIPQTVPVFADQRREYLVDLPLTLSPNKRTIGNSSANVSLCLRLRNNNEPDLDINSDATWTGATISKYRNNSTMPGDASPTQHNIAIRFTESGQSQIGFTIGGYVKETATTSDNTTTYETAMTGGFFQPDIGAAASLGGPDNVWDNVYAVTGPWTESDARLKTNVNDVPDSVFAAWGKVNFKVFQFIKAVEQKGADAARLHVGVIAQQVQEAFASEGLDASRYGLFCYDEWQDECEVDDAGNQIQTRKAGNKYGIRYEEALALECAYQRWLGEKRDAEIEALKARLEALEASA